MKLKNLADQLGFTHRGITYLKLSNVKARRVGTDELWRFDPDCEIPPYDEGRWPEGPAQCIHRIYPLPRPGEPVTPPTRWVPSDPKSTPSAELDVLTRQCRAMAAENRARETLFKNEADGFDCEDPPSKIKYERHPYMNNFGFGPKPGPVVPEETAKRRYVIHETDAGDGKLSEETIERVRAQAVANGISITETGRFDCGYASFKQQLDRADRPGGFPIKRMLAALESHTQRMAEFWKENYPDPLGRFGNDDGGADHCPGCTPATRPLWQLLVWGVGCAVLIVGTIAASVGLVYSSYPMAIGGCLAAATGGLVAHRNVRKRT